MSKKTWIRHPKYRALTPKERNLLRAVHRNMLRRCYDESEWLTYLPCGGRGITVCDEWRDSFQAFAEWALDHGWQPRKTAVRRKDTSGDFTPENCEVIPIEEFRKAPRPSKHRPIDPKTGEAVPIEELARRYNISKWTLYDRIHRGLSGEDLVLRPVWGGKRR